ncbi:cysteine hydrolase family protein [Aquibacillus albus]|uniref:Ureidoacrylate peracid hydrolase n=1 Tax=Aquibacillus albus TaxID=1168171 RepID=A0ABS2MWI8_9BACI|nr:isochorismatase family cysteine hydrolase [Aquibacillus albus]MBM7570224.1 ureidoacrylate peracid hydrolase [Aquibacillus albus]
MTYLPLYADTVNIIGKIQELTKTAKQSGMPVIYLRHVRRGGGNERLKYGSWNVELIDQIVPDEDDVIVDKPYFGGFSGTDLDVLLRGMGVETIIICGTVTNVCCETTARQAHEKEYKVIFLSDGTAAGDKPDMGWGPVSAEENHRVALTTLATLFCQVSPTDQIIDEMKEKREKKAILS